MPEKPSPLPTECIHSTAQTRHYCIELRGLVDKGWMVGFDLISYSPSDRITIIEVLTDQAGLRGILNRLWDLNLDIISVVEIRLPADRNGGK